MSPQQGSEAYDKSEADFTAFLAWPIAGKRPAAVFAAAGRRHGRELFGRDRALRHLDALLIVADERNSFLVSGTGDLIEADDGIIAVGSGGPYALSAARALTRHTQMGPREIAEESLRIAGEICIFTNDQLQVEELVPAGQRKAV